MIGICKRGHQTGTRICHCGAKREEARIFGSGRVELKAHERPRDEHGRNELDALRAATRVSGGGHMRPWVSGYSA